MPPIEDDTDTKFHTPYEQALSKFATNVVVQKPGEMVFLDFMQADVWTDPPETGQVIARIVVTQALARSIKNELDRVLQDEG